MADAEFLFKGVTHFIGSGDMAGRAVADLDMLFSYRGGPELRVKRIDRYYFSRGHAEFFGQALYGRLREVTEMVLNALKEGDKRAFFGSVAGYYRINFLYNGFVVHKKAGP